MIGPFSGGVTVFPKRRYLFVDGACFESATQRFHQRYFVEQLELAPQRLINLLNGTFDKVFYYDALPIMEENETEDEWKARTAAKRMLLETLEQTDGFAVFEGDVRRKGGSRDRREQKKVDVGIAVDMLTNAFRRNMDEASLLTGDIDFVPLLRALALEGMPVTLFHPDHATAELKRVALLRMPLSSWRLWNMQPEATLSKFPLPVTTTKNEPFYIRGAMALASWDTTEGQWTALDYDGTMILQRVSPDASFFQAEARHRRSLLHYCDDVHNACIPDPVREALLRWRNDP